MPELIALPAPNTNLARLIARDGLKTADAADKLGWTPEVLRETLAGRARLTDDDLTHVANVFGIERDSLMHESPEWLLAKASDSAVAGVLRKLNLPDKVRHECWRLIVSNDRSWGNEKPVTVFNKHIQAVADGEDSLAPGVVQRCADSLGIPLVVLETGQIEYVKAVRDYLALAARIERNHERIAQLQQQQRHDLDQARADFRAIPIGLNGDIEAPEHLEARLSHHA